MVRTQKVENLFLPVGLEGKELVSSKTEIKEPSLHNRGG